VRLNLLEHTTLRECHYEGEPPGHRQLFMRQNMCHCQQCRKQTGHLVAATRVSDKGLELSGDEHLKWFAASDEAKRGFCKHCGSVLFWKSNDSDTTAVMAGSLESPTGLETTAHIFTAFKGDYYDITDGLPEYERSD